jgi:hypothetical protein
LFTGGYDADGNCLLSGSPALFQVVPLSQYAGRLTGVTWTASALLASSSDNTDSAELKVEILGAGDRVLASATTGEVMNLPFQSKGLQGQLPPGTVSARLTLLFRSNWYSGGYADDIVFRLG